MGVRKWIERPTVRGHHVGVEDLTEGQQGVPVFEASCRRYMHFTDRTRNPNGENGLSKPLMLLRSRSGL